MGRDRTTPPVKVEEVLMGSIERYFPVKRLMAEDFLNRLYEATKVDGQGVVFRGIGTLAHDGKRFVIEKE